MKRTVTINGRVIVLQKHESIRTQGNKTIFVYQSMVDGGKRVQITAATIDRLREKEKLLQQDLFRHLDTSARNLLLNDVYKEWFRTITVRETTESNYQFAYNSYCKDALGKKRIRDIKEGDVIALYKNLLNERHLSINTVDGLHTVVQQVFLYAMKQDYIYKNPCEGVMKKLKRGAKKADRQVLSQAEEARFLEYLRVYDEENHSNWYPFFAFMLFTGLRMGEMAGLQWDDIDFERGIITIQHNLVYYRDRNGDEQTEMKTAVKMRKNIHTPKTESGYRIFKLSNSALEALSIQKEKGIKSDVTIAGFNNFVFVNRFGNSVHQGTINRNMKRIIMYANIDADERNERGENIPIIPNISSHALRRSFITRCAEAGVNVAVTAKMVGHNDIRTTLDYYTVVREDWQKDELDKLDEYMHSKGIHQGIDVKNE